MVSDRTFQFGAFEVNERAGELRKHGARIRIQEQPFQVLTLLLERPGEIVGRQEIRDKLWPDNTYVDFDNAISSAVRKLRETLGDNADSPRFIETLAKRGYRFIGPVEARSPVVPERKRTRARMISMAAGALLIVGVAGRWLWHRPEQNAIESMPVPLTAAAGQEGNPSFSPDGNQIAYSWDETGAGNNSHIYVKLIGSGRPVQLTAGAKPDSFPAWSPDGRSIAFIRSLDRGNAIYLIPPLGGTERKVVDGSFYGPSHWSPDGRFLAVADRNSPNDPLSLHRVAAENGEKLRLTTPGNAQTVDADPVFSPGGGALLFTRCPAPYTCGLYLLDLSPDYRPVGGLRRLAEESGAISGAAWSADAKEIVYAVSNDTNLNFHLMKIRIGTRGTPERLAYTGVFSPAIAPRGNRLAYAQGFLDRDIWQLQPGKPPQSFATSTRQELAPQYSPDGKRVAFSSDRSGQMEIWTGDAGGGNLVQLTNFAEVSGTPRWSSDGRWITFDRHLKSGWHIFVMASDGGQARQLNSDEGNEVIPSWSRDGNWIYYASNRTGRFEIWKAPARGGGGTQVTRSGGWTAFESHDGQSLYYTKNLDNNDGVTGLWELPIRGGNERLVVESVVSRCFAVMEEGIYYMPGSAPRDHAIVKFHDFATGQNREIASVKADGWFGTVSPDRTTFLFSVTARTGANVMLVENFK